MRICLGITHPSALCDRLCRSGMNCIVVVVVVVLILLLLLLLRERFFTAVPARERRGDSCWGWDLANVQRVQQVAGQILFGVFSVIVVLLVRHNGREVTESQLQPNLVNFVRNDGCLRNGLLNNLGDWLGWHDGRRHH